MKLAKRLAAVAPSATLTLAAKAKEMAAEGKDVVSLTAGEPDFLPPAHVLDAMKASLDRGETHYTAVPGIAELRKAVAKYTSRGELRYEESDVVVTTGAKQAIYNALMAMLDDGDQAIVIAPYWLSYADMIRLAGGEPVVVQTEEIDEFCASAAQIEAAITPKTRLLIMNSPSNPAGAVYSKEQLSAIAEVLRRHPQVFVISDDIYCKLVFGGECATLLDVAPDLKERTLVVDGCSKTYAMTGLRIGWAVGPKALVGAINKLQGQSTSNACTAAQWGAVAALTGDQSALKTMLEAFDARRRFIVGRLRAIPHVTCFDPKGAFYVFPNLSAYVGRRLPDGSTIDDAFSICAHLLHDHHLVVVPGGPFGAKNHIRLSFATDMDTIAKGVDRLRAALIGLK
jgi:aspartate aminotransferase